MMLALLIYGVPVLAWLLVVAAPRGPAFLLAFGGVAGFAAWQLSQPIRPASGPDDWFRGTGHLMARTSLVGAAAALPLQAWRWWRGMRPVAYIPLQVGLAAAIILSFVMF